MSLHSPQLRVAINAITKSGTNQFHGSLFEYFRDNTLDASNYFD